jgi:hypothetical protein
MADPLGKRRCDKCHFFEPGIKGREDQRLGYGFCHRHAPRPLERQYHAYWPVVANDHWCGEYFPGRQA